MPKTWCLLMVLTASLCLSLYAAAPAGAEDSIFSEQAPVSCAYHSGNPDCDPNKGRWGMYRMYVNATGPGHVTCGDCNTAHGCTSFWTSLRYLARCQAVAAPNGEFSNWSTQGQPGGGATTKYFGKVGLHFTAVFQNK